MCELELRIGNHVVDHAGHVFIPELGLAMNYGQESHRNPDVSFAELVEIARSAQSIEGVSRAVIKGRTYQVVQNQPITRDGKSYILVNIIPQTLVRPS